jgi:hypothetical protein
MHQIHGYVVIVENISLLNEEQRAYLATEMRVLAVATQKNLLNGPLEITQHRLSAHYLYEYQAEETVQHLNYYLQQIAMENIVTITLAPAQWIRLDLFN